MKGCKTVIGIMLMAFLLMLSGCGVSSPPTIEEITDETIASRKKCYLGDPNEVKYVVKYEKLNIENYFCEEDHDAARQVYNTYYQTYKEGLAGEKSLNTFITVLFVIMGVVLVGIIVIVLLKKRSQQKVEKAEIAYGFSFDEKSGILTISQRTREIENNVKIVNEKAEIISYEPMKIHFGSATVGNVTTGGVYTTGGYNYLSGFKNTGKCSLQYNKKVIFYIQLNDELYEKAKTSYISGRLNDKKQITTSDNPNYSMEELKELEASVMKGGSGGVLRTKGYLDFEGCAKILSWIVGNDY